MTSNHLSTPYLSQQTSRAASIDELNHDENAQNGLGQAPDEEWAETQPPRDEGQAAPIYTSYIRVYLRFSYRTRARSPLRSHMEDCYTQNSVLCSWHELDP